MYQPDFPSVPFRLGLYPVVDSVEWIARLLEAGVRTMDDLKGLKVRAATRLIASRTSLAADSMSRCRVNSMVTEALPLRLKSLVPSSQMTAVTPER